MSKHYINISGVDGLMYEKSQEKQEGFEEHENKNGEKSWRKYYRKGIFGTLKKLEVVNSPIGMQMQIVLQDALDEYTLQHRVHQSNGNVDEYVTSVTRLVKNIKLGEPYRFFSYAIEPEKVGGYWKRGVSVKVANIADHSVSDKVENFLWFPKKDEKVEANHIPPLVWADKFGKIKPTAASIEAQNDFILAHLIDNCKVLGGNLDGTIKDTSKKSNTSAPPKKETAEKKQVVTSKEVQEDDEDLGLPF
jgi:hypothetical protein